MKNTCKEDIWQEAHRMLTDKIAILKQDLSNIQESANQETKSSAGDKYETGRAMAQLEIEQLTRRIAEAATMLSKLMQIDPKQEHNRVVMGAMVQTTDMLYFISVPLGKLTIGSVVCYCISPASPIGTLFAGAHSGEIRLWQGKGLRLEVS